MDFCGTPDYLASEIPSHKAITMRLIGGRWEC